MIFSLLRKAETYSVQPEVKPSHPFINLLNWLSFPAIAILAVCTKPFVLAAIAVFFSTPTFAKFEFITSNIRDTLILEDRETIEYSFDVHFRAFDERDTTEAEDYGLTLSSSDFSNPLYEWGIGSLTPPDSPPFSGLRTIMTDSIMVTGIDNFTFEPGQWSAPVTNSQTDKHLQVTVKINKAALERANQNPFVFYLSGADYEQPLYYWTSLRVTLDLIQPATVRIAGLSDVILSENSLTSTVNACAFSSTDKASFYFKGLHGNPNTPFQLSNHARAFIPYRVEMRTKNGRTWESWQEEEHEGHLQNHIWGIRGTTEDCFENNLDIRVTVDEKNLPTNAGVYSDTMTVTVAPK